MKKIISLLLALVLCLSMGACGKEKGSPELQETLENVSWIFGEWYDCSPLFLCAEIPAMVIRADGSCTYQGQEITWAFNQTLPNTDMEASLILSFENKEKYFLFLYKDTDSRMSSALLDVNTLETVDVLSLIRSDEIETMKQTGEPFIGEWVCVSDSDRETIMVFRADGTCSVLGKEGIWGTKEKTNSHDFIYVKIADKPLTIQLNPPFENGYRTVFISDPENIEPTKSYDLVINASTTPLPDNDPAPTQAAPSDILSPADEVLAFVKRQMDGYEKIEKGQFYVWQPGLQIAFLGAVYENDCFYIDMELYCDKDPDQGRWQNMFGPNVYLVYDDTSWYTRTSNKQFTRMEDPLALVSMSSIKNGETVRCRAEIFNCVEDEIFFDRINQIYWRFELDWEILKGGTKYYIDITEWLQ